MRSKVFEKQGRSDIDRQLFEKGFSPFLKIGDSVAISC